MIMMWTNKGKCHLSIYRDTLFGWLSREDGSGTDCMWRLPTCKLGDKAHWVIHMEAVIEYTVYYCRSWYLLLVGQAMKWGNCIIKSGQIGRYTLGLR